MLMVTKCDRNNVFDLFFKCGWNRAMSSPDTLTTIVYTLQPRSSQISKTPATAAATPAMRSVCAGCDCTWAIIFFMASGNNA